MKNNGFEMQVGYNESEGDFKWFANFNMAINTNNVTQSGAGCYEY